MQRVSVIFGKHDNNLSHYAVNVHLYICANQQILKLRSFICLCKSWWIV